jgi:glyoxylase-like metal-dependent hydrolase (beta-lactamase superfamily II)
MHEGRRVTGAAVYEVFALKYAGPLTSSVAKVLFDTDWDKTIERNYYIWVVRNGTRTVVVDCGVRPALAAQRNLRGYVSPAEVLRRIGIDAERVEHLIITHIHQDHAGGLELFPRARVYLQRREFDFWVSDPIARRAPFARTSDPVAVRAVGALRGSARLALVDGDQVILPGIELLLTPGHTPALQSVAVETAKGIAVLTSDCAHVHRTFETDIPSSIICDLPEWMRSLTKLRERVGGRLDVLFPGHDAAMRLNYPEIAEDITQLA